MNDEKTLRKVIITAAVTGAVHMPTMSAYLPITPGQIAEDAIRAAEAGAAIVHVHARNPETGEPTADLDIFRDILTRIKERSDCVVCITTGGAGTVEQRIAVVPEFKPEMATLNLGSLNAGIPPQLSEEQKKQFKFDWERERVDHVSQAIFENTFHMIGNYARQEKENGAKAELEIWDIGQIPAAKWLIDREYVESPVRLQFVIGSTTGIPATINGLLFAYEEAKRIIGNFTWSLATAGKAQLPMSAVALVMGGDVRVGMEDSLYAGYGRICQSSAEQVERIVIMAKQLSIQPATPEEARQMLGLKGADKVNF
jgi:uncharacterized protein (DUF849 family)